MNQGLIVRRLRHRVGRTGRPDSRLCLGSTIDTTRFIERFSLSSSISQKLQGHQWRCLSTTNKNSDNSSDDFWDEGRVSGYCGHNFPDFIERWDRQTFRRVGYVMGASTAALAVGSAVGSLTVVPTVTMGALTTLYWRLGISDMSQTAHAIRRNYPVLGNMRYILETVRPEIRQYLVEDDIEGKPLDRMRRSLVYQRSKNVDDTLAFGTRRDVYEAHYEWACHSMFPKPPVPPDDKTTWNSPEPRRRVWVGTKEFGTSKPYSASILNVSAMSYGAISDNAILALSNGARMGHFYHVSRPITANVCFNEQFLLIFSPPKS